MSAGGISYSGVLGNRKVTLPSVESWGTDMNILRDPPKSLHTRKIDKVSSTQEVQRMIENGIDERYCDSIQAYPRGINPSVAVSYGNYGNNGGKLMHFGKGNKISGGNDDPNSVAADAGYSQSASSWEACGVSNGSTMPKYPYRIDLDGDFRPPVVTEERLKPLSRASRNVTNLYTNPLAPIWKDRNTCDECTYKRATRPDILNTTVQATSCHYLGPMAAANTRKLATANVNKMINEGMVNTNVQVNKAHNVHIQQDNQMPQRGIQSIENIETHGTRVTNLHGKDTADANQISTEQYISDKANIDVHSKYTQLANINLADMNDNNFKMRENMNIDAVTNKYQARMGNIHELSDNHVEVRHNNVTNTVTNKSQHNTATLENIAMPVKLKEQYNQTIVTNQQGDYMRNNQNTDEIKLQRNMPITNVESTVSGDTMHHAHHIYDQTYHLEQKQNHTTAYTNPNNMLEENRHNIIHDAKLQPKLSVTEGFEGRGTQPIEQRQHIQHNLSHTSNGTNKSAYNMFATRFQNNAYTRD
jgi:hypothetical protein